MTPKCENGEAARELPLSRTEMASLLGLSEETVCRFMASFRRQEAIGKPTAPESLLERGELVMDLSRLTVTWKGEVVALTVTEFWMLHALVKFPGHVKSRDALMQESKIYVDNSTITSHVKRMRKKFIQSDPDFDCIDTVYGMGYRWNE